MFHESGVTPQAAWRAASAVFALSLGVGTTWSFVHLNRIAEYKLTSVAFALWIAETIVVATRLVAAAGLFGSFAAVVYMACLLNSFFQTAYGFLSLLSEQLSGN